MDFGAHRDPGQFTHGDRSRNRGRRLALGVAAAALLFLIGFSIPWAFGNDGATEAAPDELEDSVPVALGSTSGSIDGSDWTWALEEAGDSVCASLTIDGTEPTRTCKPTEEVLISAAALAYHSPPLVIEMSEGEGDRPLRHVVFFGYEPEAVEPAPGVAGGIENVIVEGSDLCADCEYVYSVWVGPAEGPTRFRFVPDGQIVSPFGLNVATFDPAMLAAMASNGFIVDNLELPENLTWFSNEANGSTVVHTFGDPSRGETVHIGSRRGGKSLLRREATEYNVELVERVLDDGRQLFLTVDEGETVRVSQVIARRLIEVSSDGQPVDLVQVMSDLVWLGPVHRSGAAPALAEARAALDGLPLTQALRVATEAGWRIRPAIVNGQDQPLEADLNPSRVNISIAKDNTVTVLDVG